jgi:hypothetical protein
MQPRTYALSIATAGMGLFIAVVGTNLILDPQAVFGTALFSHSLNVNDRYQKFLAYQRASEKLDGLMLGSSRADAVREALAKRVPDVKFADFSVTFGTMTDYLPTLEYAVRQKASRGEFLRTVFLLLDVDSFGRQPRTNLFIQSLLPPALSGQSFARFWWKNATAIQFKAWRSSIRNAFGLKARPDGKAEPDLTRASLDFAKEVVAMASPTVAQAQTGEISKQTVPPPIFHIGDNIEFRNQLKDLQRFVALCRENRITLLVATSPLHPASMIIDDRDEAVERISRIVPLWDFSNPGWVPDDPQLWLDSSHFKPDVGRAMLGRMLGDEVPVRWRDFGRFRSPI